MQGCPQENQSGGRLGVANNAMRHQCVAGRVWKGIAPSVGGSGVAVWSVRSLSGPLATSTRVQKPTSFRRTSETIAVMVSQVPVLKSPLN